MNDDRLLNESLRALPQPPATPRERMWSQIAAARTTTERPIPSVRRAGAWRWAGGGAALAAVLVLGVAVGRWTAPPAPQSTQATEATQSPGPTLAERRASGYREATSQLFGRAEMRLAGFQAQPAHEESAAATADWATTPVASAPARAAATSRRERPAAVRSVPSVTLRLLAAAGGPARRRSQTP